MIKNNDRTYKVVLIGDSGVGKSSILIRFAENQFHEHYLATIGVDFRFKQLFINNKNIRFHIWDTAGQEKFRTLSSTYYRNAHAVLLVFDICNQSTFSNVCSFWLSEAEMKNDPNAIFILVGNKSDLSDHRKVCES